VLDIDAKTLSVMASVDFANLPRLADFAHVLAVDSALGTVGYLPEEREELPMAVTGLVRGGDRAGGDLQRCEHS
jgi:hypothetical protein